MTTATPRASDPPAATISQGHREGPAAHTILAERFRLLSMHSFPHLHPALFSHLCERTADTADTPDSAAIPDATSQPFEPHLFARWEQLLRAGGRITSGVVLLDLDEAERSPSLRALGISAHRLCELLARDLHEKPAALVLLTRMDYVEIEDLLRAGVSALLHPEHDVAMLAERVRIAMQRRQRPVAREMGADVVTTVARPAPVIQVDLGSQTRMPATLPPGPIAPAAP